MAKISARNCTEVARVNFETPSRQGGVHTGILVLRSDGRVLRRYTGDLSTGYVILGKVKAGVPLDGGVLRRYAAARNLTITKEG